MQEPHVVSMVAWTPIVGRKLPFVRRRGEELYNLIIGRVDDGESDAIVLDRIALEQIGARITPGTLKLQHKHVTEMPCVTLEVRCYDAQHKGILKACGTYDDFDWLDIEDVYRMSTLGQVICRWFHTDYLRSPLPGGHSVGGYGGFGNKGAYDIPWSLRR